jgi:hypothetical protein
MHDDPQGSDEPETVEPPDATGVPFGFCQRQDVKRLEAVFLSQNSRLLS